MRPGESPAVTSATGGSLALTTHVTAAGFNPLDLLYASVASCVVLSVRIAAQRAGVLAALGDVRAIVSGEKASEAPSRIARFLIEIEIEGEIDAVTKRRLAHEAEADICTVSNTLRSDPVIEGRYVDPPSGG